MTWLSPNNSFHFIIHYTNNKTFHFIIHQINNKMKISHDKVSFLLKSYLYPEVINKKCVHIISFLCWFVMIVLGAIIIGVGTNNNYTSFPFCTDLETFCTKDLLVEQAKTLYFYVKLSGYYQNNRNFMDAFSIRQVHGEIDNRNQCGQYYKYESISRVQTVGGYQVNPATAHIHPCGEAMKRLAVDIVYLVDSQGGTPSLDKGDLISAFNLNHFKRLEHYQLSQWTDVKSAQFVNYFSISATGTKFQLVGKASIEAGNYQIVIQNNYLGKGEFEKELIVSQVGFLGLTNHILGFLLFCYGILLLFFHLYICFRWRK